MLVDRMRPGISFVEAGRVEVGSIYDAGDGAGRQLGLLLATAADDSAPSTVLVFRFGNRADVEEMIDELRAAADELWPAS